jgi:hypothetical protein
MEARSSRSVMIWNSSSAPRGISGRRKGRSWMRRSLYHRASRAITEDPQPAAQSLAQRQLRYFYL